MITVTRFTAMWCAPCRMVAPVLNQLEGEFPDVAFNTVNTEDHPELVAADGVMSIPCVIVKNDGKTVGRITGGAKKETYRNLIQEAINESTKVALTR